MATRLPVVISQSVRREPSTVNCEEQLITELLFTAGLDATLIGPLESIEPGSTDHLCLEGMKGPFALLSWTSLPECHLQLSRLGIHGSIVDRDSPALTRQAIATSSTLDPNRRIDFHQLGVERAASVWIESLKKILEMQDVKAFSIGIHGKQPKQPIAVVAPTPPPSSLERSPIENVGEKRLLASSNISKREIDPNDDDEVWAYLDELVDHLDQEDV